MLPCWRGKMAFVDIDRKGLHIGLLAAVPPALFSNPYNPISSCSLWVTDPLPESSISACEWHTVCWHFKRAPGIPGNFHISLGDDDYQSQMLYGLCFPALVLHACESGVELRPLNPQRELLSWDIPLNSQPSHVGVCSAFFLSLSFLPVCTWIVLYIFSNKTSIQIVFSWLFKMIDLYFSYNSGLVLGEGECNFYLLCCHFGSLFIFSKKQILVLLTFSIVLFNSISLLSVILIIYFHLLILVFFLIFLQFSFKFK